MIKQGPNLFLRPYEADEWPLLENWFYSGEYEDFFREFQGAMTIDQLKSYAYMQGGYAFTIRLTHDFEGYAKGTTVGMATVFDIKAVHGTAKMGILIDQNFQRKKFCLETMWILVPFFLRKMRLRKLIVETMSDNQRLAEFTEKGGFVHEAVLKDEVIIEGVSKDIHRFYITEEGLEEKLEKAGGELWQVQPQSQPLQWQQARPQKQQLH